MSSSNLPQARTSSTDIGRSKPSLPFSYARRLERETDRSMQASAAKAFVEAAQIEFDTRTEIARVEGQTAVGGARVHGAVTLQHEETMGLGNYGRIVDNELAQAGPVARQLMTESLAQATRRVGGVTDSAIRDL